MKYFKFYLLLGVYLSFLGCNDTKVSSKNQTEICPQCNMAIPESKLHTSIANNSSQIYKFDDIGCMVLWAKKNKIDLQNIETQVFTNDTKKYINSKLAFYRYDEKTPMSYGFSAYEKEQNKTIAFDEVILKMYRGEHMANPKIRKQLLGD